MKPETWEGPPSTTWTYHDAVAGEVTLASDEKGAVKITNETEARVAEAVGLTKRPVKAEKED